MKLLTTTMALLWLITGIASAETFDRVPDLLDLVVRPIRGEYFLVCQRHVSSYQKRGRVLLTDREVRMTTNEVKLVGFPDLTMRVMKRDWGFASDPIATVLMVNLCMEDDTTYRVEAPDGVRPNRNPDQPPGGEFVVHGPRTWQQKQRTR